MKKVFESELIGYGESAKKVTIYQLDNREEARELDEMQHDELCELLGVYDDYTVAPGAVYHHYSFKVTTEFLIMTDCIAINV